MVIGEIEVWMDIEGVYLSNSSEYRVRSERR